MKKHVLSLTIMVVLSSMFCATPSLQADLIANEDFSNGLTGWTNPVGSIIATDYANMPSEYKANWDLSSWNSHLDGNFALLRRYPSETIAGINTQRQVAPLQLTSFQISFDYAVAWKRAEDVPWYGAFINVYLGAYGSSGYTNLFDYEVGYGGPVLPDNRGAIEGVITRTFLMNIQVSPPLEVDRFSLGIAGPDNWGYNNLSTIIAIDNIKVQTTPVPTPVPEPTTLLLLAAGLIGLAGFGRKKLT